MLKIPIVKIAIRQLIRYIYENPTVFDTTIVERIAIIDFFKVLGHPLRPNYISKQKALPFLSNTIPRTDATVHFFNIIKQRIPNLNEDSSLRELDLIQYNKY